MLKFWGLNGAKYVTLVDLVKSFPTSFFFKIGVDTERTSLSTFRDDSIHFVIRLLLCNAFSWWERYGGIRKDSMRDTPSLLTIEKTFLRAFFALSLRTNTIAHQILGISVTAGRSQQLWKARLRNSAYLLSAGFLLWGCKKVQRPTLIFSLWIQLWYLWKQTIFEHS